MRLPGVLLVIILLLAPSCGKSSSSARQPRRAPYDLGRSDALIKTGEALVQENANWEELASSNLLTPSLTRILQDQVARRELFLEANTLLQEQRFNDLARLIDDAEKRGEATPALLELRGLPQALQALSLFCARRPYQNSKDLEQSLDFLAPWTAELARLAPNAFPTFLESQKALLEELREAERQRAVERLLGELDESLTTLTPSRRPLVWILADLHDVDSANGIFTLVDTQGRAMPGFAAGLSQGEWDPSKELAVSVAWNGLGEGERGSVAELLKSNPAETLSGRVLRIRAGVSTEGLIDVLLAWQESIPPERISEARPLFIEECLGGSALPPVSAFPGIQEFAQLFLSLVN